jgi:ribose transport system permease protein
MFDNLFLRRRLARFSSLRCLLFFAVLVTTFSFLSPHFLSRSNFDNILAASAVTGLLAIGSTFVIGSGGIDLSIASVMALSGTVCASLVQNSALGPFAAFAICVGTAGFSGALTGLLVNITKAPSFIVTLGMLSVARAIAYIVAGGIPIYGLPESVTYVGQGEFFGISLPVLLFLSASLVAVFILRQTVFGIQTLLLGDNPSAAEAAGINANTIRLKVHMLCGVFSGIAGYVFMARTNAGDPTAGQNYELLAITAVILGGTKLFGGRATIFGTAIGAACLGTLQNGLNLLAVSSYYQVLFVGVVLIGAALLERFGGDA